MTLEHLYIHVPFCGRRCVYCDFSIAVRRETPVAEYLAALGAELSLVAPNEPLSLRTVYLGGGTPSRIGPEGIASVLALVTKHAGLTADAEVTIEANPEDVTIEAAKAWRQAGVNRVSLGVQSFNDEVLKWMHRNHSGADAVAAVGNLRSAGIYNISVDLIFALPELLDRQWADDLGAAVALEPPHISIYGLTVEPGTPLSRWVTAGSVSTTGEDPYADQFLEADAILTAAGFDHYEVSNYAKPGFQSRHNSAYWSGAEYLGVGPSAHSFVRGERRWNVRAYEEWKSRSLRGERVVTGSEILDAAARDLESIYLGLRTSGGYRARASDSERVKRWVAAGWGTLVGESIHLNAAGWLRLDALASDLGGADAPRNYISGHGSSAA